MRTRVKIKVFGLVQGVFFRESTRKKAEELGVQGMVKNKEDGSVYIDAEGEEDDLRKLVDWCHQGSAGSRVDKVEYDFISDLKNYQEFKIEF